MRSERVVRAAHYAALLFVSLGFAALLALLLMTAPSLPIQTRAYAIAAALVAYLVCAFVFAALWPESAQGDAILLASPAVALVAAFAAVALVAPDPTEALEGQRFVLLAASALAVLLGTTTGIVSGRAFGRKRAAG